MNKKEDGFLTVAIIIALLLVPVFLVYAQDIPLEIGNSNIKIQNNSDSNVVILGAWSHAICFETKHECYTMCKGRTEVGLGLVGICDFNYTSPIEDLGITHIVTEVFTDENNVTQIIELEWLSESYPNIYQYVEVNQIIQIGNRTLIVFKITGTVEQLKGKVSLNAS